MGKAPALRSRCGRLLPIAGALAVLIAIVSAPGCREAPAPSSEVPPPVKRSLNEVLASHDAHLLSIPGVAIVFIGVTQESVPCIVVGVTERTAEVEKAIPTTLEGHPVEIRETGAIGPR